MSGSTGDGGEPPLDRTQAFRPEGADTPAPPSDLPRIPGITLHFEVARGGMGVVYSGRQDFLDRRVAVKLLSIDLVGEKFAQRFRREAKLLAGIKHPNIVACHSAGTTDAGQSYLVMEFVDGPSMKAWIAEQGPLPTKAALRLTKAVAQALAHAHQLDVIHRDVKPENILLEAVTSTAIDMSFPYTPKLVDLGLARMTSESAEFGLTSPGAVMGTPSTMSPEQFDDPDSVDFRTDIYGLGCALYEMLVGTPAYRGTKLTEIVTRKRAPIGPNPCEEVEHVPFAVGELVSSMLAADRGDRPGSYRELDERIDELLATLPADVPRTTPAKRAADTDTGAKMARTPAAMPAAKSGPGLLRTAEIDFLQEGMGGGGTATPAFKSDTMIAEQAPPAPPAETAAGSRRGLFVAAGVGAIVLLTGVVWFASRGSGDGATGGGDPKPPVVTNAPPGAATIEGPQSVELLQWVNLTALAADPEGDRLRYDWSTPVEIQRSDEKQNTIKVRLIDGLPNETFDVQVAISDGFNAPVVASTSLRLIAEAFPSRPFLVAIKSDPRWTLHPPDQGLTWTPLLGMDVVSCKAPAGRQTATTSMGVDTFWQVTGELLPRRSGPDVFASIAVRLELGNDGWSMVCTRTGEEGERWSIELVQEVGLAGAWEAALTTGERPRVEWLESFDSGAADKDYPYGQITLTRRRDKITLQLGRNDALETKELTVPPDIEPHVSLWADSGSGEFRDFKLR